MTQILLSIGLVAVFILVGGLFAATELALVSLREGQVRAFSERGRRGARVARLTADPNRFLATVQIGVTLAGFMSAAFGEATLAGRLETVLAGRNVPGALADILATVIITLIISYFAIVFGELVPKRVALQRVEGVALILGPPLDRTATALRPFIWLLSRSTDVIVRLLGVDPGAKRDAITEEELRDLVSAHEALSTEERELITEVFAAGKRQLREVMIPRTEVDFLDATMPLSMAAKATAATPHSRFPVYRGSYDQVLGFVHVRDLLGMPATTAPTGRVGELARPMMMLPDSRTVLAAMTDLRRAGQHIAVVVDEYGGTAGIVTLEDVIEELVGDIRDEYDPTRRSTTRHSDGDVEVDGLLNLDEFTEATHRRLPDGPYETVAGFILTRLGRLAVAGDTVDVDTHGDPPDGGDEAGRPTGFRLTVTELDGRRISRARVTRIPEPHDDSGGPAEGVSASPDAVAPGQEGGGLASPDWTGTPDPMTSVNPVGVEAAHPPPGAESEDRPAGNEATWTVPTTDQPAADGGSVRLEQ